MPLEGGAPRKILPNVESAEWGPDGTTLLITRQASGSDLKSYAYSIDRRLDVLYLVDGLR